MSAGTIIPPAAAMIGSAAALRPRSSPKIHSRLISRATTMKKRAIRPSLTTARSENSMREWPATSNLTGPLQNDSNAGWSGVFAMITAMITAMSAVIMATAVLISRAMRRCIGRTTERGM
jgi:hypothetical protein